MAAGPALFAWGVEDEGMTQDQLENGKSESREEGAFGKVPEHPRPVLLAHRERLLIGISTAAAIALVIGGVNAYFNHELGIARTMGSVADK